MANEFLEERLPICVRIGATYADEYNVEITETASGVESRRLVHPYPRRVYNIIYTQSTADIWDQILSLYHRCYGMFAGFRVKAIDDFTTNARTLAPTAFDQILKLVSAGVYQLQVAYGVGSAITIGRPYRTIFKPVAGTVLIGIGSAIIPSSKYSVSNTTGIVTFTANNSKAITNITQAAAAVVTVGSSHGFTAGESIYFSGVGGMTQINGLRGVIASTGATTITVSINSTGFGAYTSGGTAQTNPQAGEIVYGGCEYDIPSRFNSRIDVNGLTYNVRESGQIEIIELLNI